MEAAGNASAAVSDTQILRKRFMATPLVYWHRTTTAAPFPPEKEERVWSEERLEDGSAHRSVRLTAKKDAGSNILANLRSSDADTPLWSSIRIANLADNRSCKIALRIGVRIQRREWGDGEE